MSAILQLDCWLVSDDATQVFQVKITNNESVGVLSNAEKKLAIDYLRASDRIPFRFT
jgi:hypothetical protein